VTEISSVSAQQSEFPVVERGYDRATVDRFRSDVARALAAYEVELGLIDPLPDPNDVAADAGAAEAEAILEAALAEYAEIAAAAEARTSRALQAEEAVAERLARLRSVLEDGEADLERALSAARAEFASMRSMIATSIGGVDDGHALERLRDVVGMPVSDAGDTIETDDDQDAKIVVDLRDPGPILQPDADRPGFYERRLAGLRERLDAEGAD
jgi:hypothetical protein